MKILRIHTGACQRCGSQITARLRKGRDGKMSFNFGSPVAFYHNPGQHNCICLHCGIMWTGSYSIKIVPIEEIKALKSEWNIELKRNLHSRDNEYEIFREITGGLDSDQGAGARYAHGLPTSILHKAVSFIIKETVLAPGRSLHSLSDDLTTTISVYNAGNNAGNKKKKKK